MRWEGWSSFQQLKVDLANDCQLVDTNQKTGKTRLRLIWAHSINLMTRLLCVAGYLYGQNPVPDSTFEPAIPDSDTHLFCIGTGLNFKRLSL